MCQINSFLKVLNRARVRMRRGITNKTFRLENHFGIIFCIRIWMVHRVYVRLREMGDLILFVGFYYKFFFFFICSFDTQNTPPPGLIDVSSHCHHPAC